MLFHLASPREKLFPFFIHSSSKLAQIWIAIFCHNREASTLPCRKHLLKLKQLSTHSNVALPDSPDISRRRTEISHPCVLWLSKILATCFGFASSKAVLMSKLARYIVGLTTVPCFITEFLSSCPSQQIRNQHLQVLAPYSIHSSNM